MKPIPRTQSGSRNLIDSTLTVALLTAMSVRTVGASVVANLGWDKVKARHIRSSSGTHSIPNPGLIEARVSESAHAGYRYRFYSRVESGRQGSDELRAQHADLQTEALTRSCRRKLTSCVRNLNQKLFSASPPDINRRRGICP
jgi:hypothetical protein